MNLTTNVYGTLIVTRPREARGELAQSRLHRERVLAEIARQRVDAWLTSVLGPGAVRDVDRDWPPGRCGRPRIRSPC